MSIFSRLKERRKFVKNNRARAKIYRRGGFPYEYNGKVCAVDAFEAYQRLAAEGFGNLQGIYNGFLRDDPEYTKKFKDLMERVFGVKPFDGENGMTLHEMYVVVSDFMSYLDRLKKNYFGTQGSPLSTVTTPQAEPLKEEEKPEEAPKDSPNSGSV